MARQPRPAPEVVADGINPQALAAANHALAVHTEQASEVVGMYGDGSPYERTRVVAEARFYKSQASEAMLELGKRLVLIKEHEAHGDFTDIVEGQLGISARTARRFMAAAVKYLANPKTATLAVLGKSKLFELMDETGDDLEDLADGGTIAGKTLDEIQVMTTSELRNALLEERRKTAAKDRVIANKDAKLNKLAEAEEIRRNGKPDEREASQVNELRDAGLAAELALQQLVAAVAEVLAVPATQAAELQARQTLDFICQRMADLCGQFDVAVDLLGERVEPGWVRDIAEAANGAAPARKRRA